MRLGERAEPASRIGHGDLDRPSAPSPIATVMRSPATGAGTASSALSSRLTMTCSIWMGSTDASQCLADTLDDDRQPRPVRLGRPPCARPAPPGRRRSADLALRRPLGDVGADAAHDLAGAQPLGRR